MAGQKVQLKNEKTVLRLSFLPTHASETQRYTNFYSHATGETLGTKF